MSAYSSINIFTITFSLEFPISTPKMSNDNAATSDEWTIEVPES